MVTTDGAISRPHDASMEEEEALDASQVISGRTPHREETPTVDTAALITLVRRAPALTALREQPLGRRDLEECLDVSKPTVHRLTRTLDEMGLVERSGGVYILTRLGEAVADVVAEFAQGIETTFRLAPLLETLEYRHSTSDVTAFSNATVTTAGIDDPYRPVRRYYSLIEGTKTLCGFDTMTPPPKYIDTVYHQIRDGMEIEFIYQPDVADGLLSEHPDRMAELLESSHLILRVHPDLPHGLAIFDERVAIASYCETTGALRTLTETDSSAAREWAEEVYAGYRAEATELSDHPELS